MIFKKLKILLAFLLILLPISVYAEDVRLEWDRHYTTTSGEVPPYYLQPHNQSLVISNSGNIYVTGTTAPYPYYNGTITTIKYNSIGTMLWVNSRPNAISQTISSAIDSQDNLTIPLCCLLYPYIDIAQYNSNGTENWTQNVLMESSELKITTDTQNNIYVAGRLSIIKYNSSGNLLWNSPYPTELQNFYPHFTTTDSTGTTYLLGVSQVNYQWKPTTIKYDTNGNHLWTAIKADTAFYTGPEMIVGIAIGPSGDIYILGTQIFNIGEVYAYAYSLTKYNSSGIEQWTQTFNEDYSYARDLAVDSQDNIYVTGSSFYNGEEYHIVSLKYDAAGNKQWTKRYTAVAGHGSTAMDMTTDSSGNIYILGRTRVYGNAREQSSLIKYSPAGNEQWAMHYNKDYYDFPISAAVDPTDNRFIYVTGWSTEQVTNFQYVTLKYNQTQISTIANIIEVIDSMLAEGIITSTGTANSLKQFLNGAQANINSGNISGAITKLNSAINLLQTQSGKTITAAAANELIGYINRIIQGL